MMQAQDFLAPGAPAPPQQPQHQQLMAAPHSKQKIYVRMGDEQFALPLAKARTCDEFMTLLARIYPPAVLHHIQIRYDTTELDAFGNSTGQFLSGAVIYPQYWEFLVEDGMRIALSVLPEPMLEPGVVGNTTGENTTPDGRRGSVLTIAPGDEKKENTATDSGTPRPRSYSSAAAAAAATAAGAPGTVAKQPLGVVPPNAIPRAVYPRVTVMPEDTSLQKHLSAQGGHGHVSALTPAEAALKSVTDPYGLTYQACITLLSPLLPERRRLTHPRLSPNIVTIRPCHENTLWIFCVVQRTLHPVTVRAFETIDIEELLLHVVPPSIGKERAVVLWRNMKFGGEALNPNKYNAKKETRGTGGRVMWKKNLAVLAVKNAEVFVVVYENPGAASSVAAKDDKIVVKAKGESGEGEQDSDDNDQMLVSDSDEAAYELDEDDDEDDDEEGHRNNSRRENEETVHEHGSMRIADTTVQSSTSSLNMMAQHRSGGAVQQELLLE
ncbi:uncharacterized protein V1518DRAFT_421616 [Limtongia smithiae]|uniref:uncharacterized protein n=1 Tax=Limtongia smithiae TaxID=1125753 RepID=UPI0034CF594A